MQPQQSPSWPVYDEMAPVDISPPDYTFDFVEPQLSPRTQLQSISNQLQQMQHLHQLHQFQTLQQQVNQLQKLHAKTDTAPIDIFQDLFPGGTAPAGIGLAPPESPAIMTTEIFKSPSLHEFTPLMSPSVTSFDPTNSGADFVMPGSYFSVFGEEKDGQSGDGDSGEQSGDSDSKSKRTDRSIDPSTDPSVPPPVLSKTSSTSSIASKVTKTSPRSRPSRRSSLVSSTNTSPLILPNTNWSPDLLAATPASLMDLAQSAKPVYKKPAKPLKPLKQVKHVKPAKPVKPLKSTKPTKPTLQHIKPSPVIHPKPSRHQILPDLSLVLASKSNYQTILEGTHSQLGLSYPDSLSADLTSKRTSHKLAEQGRRNRINAALADLAKLLAPQHHAASKALTVEMAIDYIKSLQMEIHDAKERLAKYEM